MGASLGGPLVQVAGVDLASPILTVEGGYEAGPVPTLTVAGSLHVLTSFSDTFVAPQLTPASAWRIPRRHLVYLGIEGLLASTAPSRPVVGPLAGGELRLGRYGLTLEAAIP